MGAPGGGDVRVINNPTLNPLRIFGYVLKAPFGGDGWVMSTNNMEDLVGGHIWVGVLCIIGGIFHVTTKPYGWARRAFVWLKLQAPFDPSFALQGTLTISSQSQWQPSLSTPSLSS